MPAAKFPPIEYVRQCLRYEDGKLFWLVRPRGHFRDERCHKLWNTRHAGREAGGLSGGRGNSRRWSLRILDQLYLRYRIVYYLHTGADFEYIDHINRNPLDDRIENLRPATRGQNCANSVWPNACGHKGVRKHHNKWLAQITFGGANHYLGLFSTPEEAHAAYMTAAREQFGEFARGG